MKVAFDGIGEQFITFETNKALKPGVVVNLIDNGQVDIAEENGKFIGMIISYKENTAVVQMAGYCFIEFSGELPEKPFGKHYVCTDENGFIKFDDKGNEIIVCEIDQENKKLGILL